MITTSKIIFNLKFIFLIKFYNFKKDWSKNERLREEDEGNPDAGQQAHGLVDDRPAAENLPIQNMPHRERVQRRHAPVHSVPHEILQELQRRDVPLHDHARKLWTALVGKAFHPTRRQL